MTRVVPTHTTLGAHTHTSYCVLLCSTRKTIFGFPSNNSSLIGLLDLLLVSLGLVVIVASGHVGVTNHCCKRSLCAIGCFALWQQLSGDGVACMVDLEVTI